MSRDPATTHSFPEYVKGIQKILDYYKLKANSDRIVKEREG
jgi:heterodisulfide reductase subunit C